MLDEKRSMIDKGHPELSMSRQCDLLSIHRSGLYYKPCEETPINLDLMKMIDQEYTKYPFYGVPRMTRHLKEMGYLVNEKDPKIISQNGTQGHLSKTRNHNCRQAAL